MPAYKVKVTNIQHVAATWPALFTSWRPGDLRPGPLDSTMRYTRVATTDLAKGIERCHPREKEWKRRGTKA